MTLYLYNFTKTIRRAKTRVMLTQTRVRHGGE